MAKITVKTRHELPNGTIVWEQLEGTVVVVPGYEQYTFVFHRRHNIKGWFISELTTGLAVYPGIKYCKNKEQAISTARDYLDQYSKALVSIDKAFIQYLTEVNKGELVNQPVTRAKQRRLL